MGRKAGARSCSTREISALAKDLHAEGLIDDPPLFQMVLGVKWGAPSGIEPLLYQRGLLPPELPCGALSGIGPEQMPILAHTALLGGHVRVGVGRQRVLILRGVFATNGQLVARARTLLDCLGLSVATPAEARGKSFICGSRRSGEKRHGESGVWHQLAKG